jgi:phosphoribosylglycinamide formyltransferase-1
MSLSEERHRPRRVGILISGRGSNLQAIIDAIDERRLDATIAIVISNRADARGLEFAQSAHVPTRVIDHRTFPTREDYDRALVAELRAQEVDLVCLAGFMRLLSPIFIGAFRDRILNIHPSLLPNFPGLHPQQQAIDHGAAMSGATVHRVNEDLDAGPIVLQRTVPVLPGDTADTLAARILVEEHRLYPEAIQRVLEELGASHR